MIKSNQTNSKLSVLFPEMRHTTSRNILDYQKCYNLSPHNNPPLPPLPNKRHREIRKGKKYILQIMETLFFSSSFLLASMIPQHQSSDDESCGGCVHYKSSLL